MIETKVQEEHRGVSVKFLPILMILLKLPVTINDPLSPLKQEPGEAFKALGCTCGETLSNGYLCETLPAFGDNEWTNNKTEEFAAKAKDFSARVKTVLEDFHDKYYLALQGWADKRQITRPKTWGQASRECRGRHNISDIISNYDLAFLRACELRRSLGESIAREMVLLPPVDFSDTKNQKQDSETYSGNKYKAAVLFIISPNRGICGHENQSPK